MPTYTPLGPGWTITSTQTEDIALMPTGSFPGADGVSRPYRAPNGTTRLAVQVVPGTLVGDGTVTGAWAGNVVAQQRIAGFAAPYLPVAYVRGSDGQASTAPVAAADVLVLDVSQGADARLHHAYTSGTLTLCVVPLTGR